MEGRRAEHDDPVDFVRHSKCELTRVHAAQALPDQSNGRRVFVGQFANRYAQHAPQLIQFMPPVSSLRPEISPESPALGFETVLAQKSVQPQQGAAGCHESRQGDYRPVAAAVRRHLIQQPAAADTRREFAARSEHIGL